MNKFLILIILVIAVSCCPNDNKGYGYETKSSPEKNFLEKVAEERSAKTMNLYDTKGKLVSSCAAFKGEFDGHTWYVFYDNLASPSVEHDPLCECKERKKYILKS